MKNARERMDVIAAYREVGSYRGAAAICGTTHKTVKRIIEAHELLSTGDCSPVREQRGRNFDAVADLVAAKVKETRGRISAKRLLPAARAAGYAGSDRKLSSPGRRGQAAVASGTGPGRGSSSGGLGAG